MTFSLSEVFLYLFFGCCTVAALYELLIAVASLVAEHRLQLGLSSCGARTQWLRGTWDHPGPGTEPVSPALAGRFLSTVPTGKSSLSHFLKLLFSGHFQCPGESAKCLLEESPKFKGSSNTEIFLI